MDDLKNERGGDELLGFFFGGGLHYYASQNLRGYTKWGGRTCLKIIGVLCSKIPCFKLFFMIFFGVCRHIGSEMGGVKTYVTNFFVTYVFTIYLIILLLYILAAV